MSEPLSPLVREGRIWEDPVGIREALVRAAAGFIRHEGGGVQIWAADRDWFLEEWGRDTFIALPGLLLATGRYAEAQANIRGFARYEHEGLIPNRIADVSKWTPQNPQGAEYNLNPPPGVRTEAIEAGLDVRKACLEERSAVGNYASTAEVRLTTQTGPSHPHPGVGGVSTPRRQNATPGDGFSYNTSDGPMWFVQVVRHTAAASGDEDFAVEMTPVVRRIMERYRTGTGYRRYNRFNRIYMDSDGLVVTPAQSTWMDADPDGLDRPVTPRNGKAVEINALWYANLRYLAHLERRSGRLQAAAEAEALADRVCISFNERFWFEPVPGNGALRDVVDGDPFGDEIRPNMLVAVSVGGDLLPPERRRAVVLTATRELLTPYGMRTLSYRSPRYCERYDTSQPPIIKDQAYHQGTAWPWLLGPYADALVAVRRQEGWEEPRIQEELRALTRPLLEYLLTHRDGTIPEVFDGGRPSPALQRFSLEDPAGLTRALAEPSDQAAGGTRSQAWSVAEVLRVAVRYGLLASL